MLSEILSKLYITPGLFCMAYFVKIAAPIKKPVLYAFLSMAMQQLVWVINRFCLPEYSIFLDVIVYPIIFLLLFFFTQPYRRFQAFLAQAVLAVIPIIISYTLSMTVLPIVAASGMDPLEFTNRDGPYYGMMSFIVNILSILAMYGSARLLKLFLQPAKETNDLLWFLTIPFSQILLITLFVNLSFIKTSFRGASICIFLGILLSVGADIACIFGYRRFRRMQITSLKLQEAEHQLEIQASHYGSLQKDILSINQIRHDLKNQLNAAYYLLEHGHPNEVIQQLDLLNDQLSQKVGTRFCENLMADAVLTEKAELCQEQGIQLDISAPVPQKIFLDNGYLCSAFSNLLDNAIQGTLRSNRPHGPIDLSSDIQGEYLVIRCSNPAKQPIKKKDQNVMREHGLGLQILSRIAKLGQGDFRTNYENGIFTAILILKK